MAEFNPDKFLADTSSPDSGFDPDKFLSETIVPEQGIGERITRGALRTLPLVGGVVGGVAATPADIVTGPMGTVAGAAMGAAAGKSLQNILERYLLGDEKTRKEIYLGPLDAAKDAATFEMGGQVIGALPGLVKAGINSAKASAASKLGQDVNFTPLANKEAVEAAAKKLGIDEVPKAVLTSNPTFQKLESGLSQSGSLPAKPVREQYNKFFKGIEDASKKISELKTPDSEFALGSQIQKGMAGEVESLRKPVSELYQSFQPDLTKIEVDKTVVNKVFGALKKNPLFQTKDGKALLEEYKSAAGGQPDLASLKEWRSSIGDSIGPASTPLDAKRIDAIRNAITAIRDNSINALKTQFPKSAHGEIDNLINEIALADSAHTSTLKDLNSVKGIIGNREINSPTAFINKLGDMKEADLAQRAANLDVTSLKNLKEKFPNIFEKAKTARVNDMIQSSSPGGIFKEGTFLRQYSKLDKEMKDLIFTPEVQGQIESLQTLRSSIPPKLGPSGTPEGQMMMDMFNPKRSALDYGIKKVLEKTESAPIDKISEAIPKNVIPIKKVSPVSQAIPRVLEKSSQNVSYPAAAKNEPKKGPEKWASDGLEKIQQHSGNSELKDKLKKMSADDPKIKNLLIRASDLKPGSKAMDEVMAKLKERVSGGKE